MTELSSWIIEDLKKSGLSDDTIREMKIEELAGTKGMDRLNKLLGFSHLDNHGILVLSACYAIPYPGENFTRVKLRHKIKDAKYLSPKRDAIDTAFHLYYLPSEQEKLSKQKYALIVTEGEKKTAKITQELRQLDGRRKAVAVGIPGVTMWRDCPEWKQTRLSSREVYICFDADFRENPDVQYQMLGLFLGLRKQKANVKVMTFEEGKGIDDHLVIKEQEGSQSSDVLRTLMETAMANIFDLLEHINHYKLADALAASYYSIEEDSKALWDEFKLGRKYHISFATFKKMLSKAYKEKEKKQQEQQAPTVEQVKGEKKESEKIPFCFWYETREQELKINQAALYAWLEKEGICKIFPPEDPKSIKRILVLIKNNMVKEISTLWIQNFVSEKIKTLPEQISPTKTKDDLFELFLRGINVYIMDDKLNTIPFRNIDFVQDEKEKSFFFFKNGFVEVEKESVALKEYSRLQGYIWESQVICHDLMVMNNEEYKTPFPFVQFLQNICSIRNKETKITDNQRYLSLLAVLGYLLHNHKTTSNKFAIILTEANLTNEPQGRTGKGLLMQAVNKLRKVTILDGKNFSFDSQFAFQNVELDTQILFFDDVQKYFQFERLFSAITEGLSFERKHKDRVNLPPEKSPKIVVSTNFAIQGNSESHKGRKYEMELLCYYSSKFTPVDEFGKEFFHSWDTEEWNYFYNFMIQCVQWYLRSGKIPVYGSETVAERRFVNTTSNEFLTFADKLGRNIEISVNDTYAQYLEYSGQDKKDLSNLRFSKWIRAYCEFKKLEHISLIRTVSGKSIRFFIMKTNT